MKKSLLILAALALFVGTAAAEKTVESPYSYEYRDIAQKLQGPSAPFEKDGCIVFSAELGPRYVGIAFDFENYQIIHPFMRKTTYDENNDPVNTWYFYILEDVPQVSKIYYRMIIDGLWTTDSHNPQKYYDTQTGIHLSELTVHKRQGAATRTAAAGNSSATHFVYRGKSGQKVRLAGTFTKWDSWIYELKETAAGLYELDLPLPTGTYYYVYYIGAERFPDRTNHDMAWTEDGRPISKLVVE
ncbi:MAG: isoamylase [Treponema sp.]|nr:isoamylase [Treponema sp.]